jgi:3-phenylpropionate/trans-cinnamate dioxygenase ferredoxin reductase subunit
VADASPPIVVVGAGQAGHQICESLRRAGYDGGLVLVGEEPVPPYQRPPLSKQFLLGEVEPERLLFRPRAHYDKLAIELRLGTRATAIDRARRTVTLASGETLAWRGLALATGTRVRELACQGAALPGIVYLRTLADAGRLKDALAGASRVAIVGGGFIGLEVAAVARAQGKTVAVIEAQDRLMARGVSPFVSTWYADLHRRHGVEILLGHGIAAVRAEAGALTVATTAGAERAADLVVVGIGVLPNSELAADCGLDCRDGIVVDACARTSDPAIVAAGDCTMHENGFLGRRLRLESVQHAVDHAKVAAASLLGGSTPYRQVPWFWSDQYDVKLQIAGLCAVHDQAVMRGDPATGAFSIFYFGSGALVGADSINRPAEHMACRKLLAQGTMLSPAQAADPGVDLAQLARA